MSSAMRSARFVELLGERRGCVCRQLRLEPSTRGPAIYPHYHGLDHIGDTITCALHQLIDTTHLEIESDVRETSVLRSGNVEAVSLIA